MPKEQTLQRVGMKLDRSAVPTAGIARVMRGERPIEISKVIHFGGDLQEDLRAGKHSAHHLGPSMGIDHAIDACDLRGKPCIHGRFSVGRFSAWPAQLAVAVPPGWSLGAKTPMLPLPASSRHTATRRVRSMTIFPASTPPITRMETASPRGWPCAGTPRSRRP